ncbi:hypothetical protein MCOR06_004651 [Pyricularia oryzae]|nr:hypothetical protein MCOR06_004651 [Pyricularia oryzae]
MIGLKSTLILALAAFSAAASIDSAVISRRQASGVTCGNNNYSSNQVQAAVDRGCSLFASGSTEFPILNNKVYTGGSPGADRVAFTTKNDGTCTFAGAMTHTGASGNNFVSCRGSTSVSDAPTDKTDKTEKTEKQNNAASSLSAGGVAMPVIAAVLVAI